MNKEIKIERMDNGFLAKVYDQDSDKRSPIKKLVAANIAALTSLIEAEFKENPTPPTKEKTTDL